MSQFKAGDIVVCVDNEYNEGLLVIGKEYTVKQVCIVPCGIGVNTYVQLEDIKPSYSIDCHYDFNERRFILKQSNPEEKPVQNANINTNPNPALPLAAIQHYTANNQNLLFSVEDGKLVVTNIEKDQRCVVESLEEAVEALKLLDNISKSYKEWDEFYKEKEHVR